MRTITINYGPGVDGRPDHHGFEVVDEYGRTTGALCLGELIEQVTCMVHPKLQEVRYAMATPEQWDQRWKSARERASGEFFPPPDPDPLDAEIQHTQDTPLPANPPKEPTMPREYTPSMDCTTLERPRITLKPVTSNQVAAIGYCHDTKTLACTFTRGNGAIYHYPDVEPEQACAFFMADSLGRHFGEHIAKLPSLKFSPDHSAIVGDGPLLHTENPDHGEHLATA